MKTKLENLLKKLEVAYAKSDNKKHYTDKKKWGYHLINTYLEKNEPLIIGFNSGIDKTWIKYKNGEEYLHQTDINKIHFTDLYKGSLQRAMNMCEKHFPEIHFEKGSHSNFCYFRSEKENQITQTDIELCKPIFGEMINIVKPSVIFCFSDKARKHLKDSGIITKYEEERFKLEGYRSCLSAKAEINDGIKIYFLPHPNRPIKKEIRDKTWEYCTR
jgi:uracil-DNA glycosylase